MAETNNAKPRGKVAFVAFGHTSGDPTYHAIISLLEHIGTSLATADYGRTTYGLLYGSQIIPSSGHELNFF